MKKYLFAAAAATAVIASPAAAQDQQAKFHVGATAGYHQFDEIDFNEVGINATTDVDGMAYGGFAGVTFPTGGDLIVGAEANFSFGTDSIDNEYGISGILGTKIGETSRIYVRSGYQWVEFDVGSIAENAADDLGLSGSDRDTFVDAVLLGVGDDNGDSGWLVGAGADFGIGDTAFLRVNADTIEFDTLRLSAGVGLNF